MAMSYKKILNHMKQQRSFPLWRYGCNWLRLAYDAKTECIFLTHYNNWSNKIFNMDMSKSELIIRPDDTLFLPTGNTSGAILGTLGVPGRFKHRLARLVRDSYLHECMTEYEAFPGLVLNFKNGKPMNSRLLNSFKTNKNIMKEVNEQIAPLKLQYCNLARLKDAQFVSNWQSVKKNFHTDHERDKAFLSALKRREKWSETMDCMMQWAVSTMKYRHGNGYSVPELFDFVVKNHKSAAYRKFGAIY